MCIRDSLLAVLVLAALLVAWLFYRPLRKTLQTLRSSDEALPKNESVISWPPRFWCR